MNKYNVLEIVTRILLFVSLVLAMTVGYQILTKGYVSIGGYSMFRVVTGSMEPTIYTGSLLICEEYDIDEIEVDDIVCFRSSMTAIKNQIVTHRVIEVQNIENKVRLITKGDANTVEDALYVSSSNLIGKVTWYSQEGNIIAKVISFMNGQIGFLACIVVPVLVVCGLTLHHSMINIQKEIAELRRLEIESQRDKIEDVKEHQETEEELRARLRAEIRKELGLEDE